MLEPGKNTSRKRSRFSLDLPTAASVPSEPATTSATTRATAILTLLGLLLGTVLIGAIAAGLHIQSERLAQASMDRQVADVQDLVEAQTTRYVDALRLVAASAGSTLTLDRAYFDRATAPLHRMDLPGTTSVAFVTPPTPSAQVAQTQRDWRARGANGLTLTPAGSEEHLFPVLSRSLDGRNSTGVGHDLNVSAALTGALTESRRTDTPSITDAYRLLADRNGRRAQLSFALAMPVWHRAAADPQGSTPRLTGWVVIGVRGQDFMSAALGRGTRVQLDVTLRASDEKGANVTVARVPARYDNHRNLHHTTTVPVAQRTWELRADAASGQLSGGGSPALLGAIIGLLLAFVFAVGALQVVRRRGRAHAHARSATDDLREAEAVAQRDVYFRLLETLSDLGEGVTVVQGGRFTYVNDAYCALTGRSASELLALASPLLLAPSEERAAWTQRRPGDGDQADGDQADGEFVEGARPVLTTALRHSNGERVPIEATTIEVRTGPDPMFVSVVRNLSDRVRSEGRLVQMVSELEDVNDELRSVNRFKDDVVAMLSHDLRQPLTSAIGFCELVLAEWDSLTEEARRGYVARANRAGHWVNDLLEDVLTMARIDQGDAVVTRAEVDVAVVIGEVVSRLGADEAAIDTAGVRSVRASVDQVHLQQMMANVLGNALAYGEPPVTITARASSGTVVIDVIDCGDGVPDEFVPHLFERFTRAQSGVAAQKKGTGLGLFIAGSLAGANDGTLRYQRASGRGARFTITLRGAGTSASDAPRAVSVVGGDSCTNVVAAPSSAASHARS